MYTVFTDRNDAGRQLAQRLSHYRDQDCLVLGIPRGGVPVGYEISKALGCPLDVIVPRKLPIPWSPEAGFGAVMPDGTRVLNEEMVAALGLTEAQIDAIARQVVAEVQRREWIYRGARPPPQLEGRTVILTDDGLATGYTMIAGALATRKQRPKELVVAVPVSPRGTAAEMRRVADAVVIVHVSDAMPFAVAMFYHSFTDMADTEVKYWLDRAAAERPETGGEREAA